jgi:hypothetical protein
MKNILARVTPILVSVIFALSCTPLAPEEAAVLDPDVERIKNWYQNQQNPFKKQGTIINN